MSDEFIDVDFQSEPQYVFGSLGARMFGACASFGESIGVIPENEWRGHIEKMDAENSGIDQLVTRIYSQENEGSCVANACSQAHEILQAAQFGKENVVHLSAISLYKRIGRSPSSGAMIDDGLEEIAKRGVLPLDTPENRARFGEDVMPNTGFNRSFPSANWQATAIKFRVTEWFVLRKFEELISAGIKGHPVVVGRSGHSICYCRPMYRNGSLVFKYANSWGNWGDKGFGYDSMSMIRQSASWAFAARSVVVNE